jgi:hypothetical protein
MIYLRRFKTTLKILLTPNRIRNKSFKERIILSSFNARFKLKMPHKKMMRRKSLHNLFLLILYQKEHRFEKNSCLLLKRR